MLNSIKPPTDNLYKFMAISGLVCLIVGVVLSVQLFQKTLEVGYASEGALHEAWLALAQDFEDGDDETAFKLLGDAWKTAERGENVFGLTQEARKLGTLDGDQLTAVRRFEIAAESFAHQMQEQRIYIEYLGYGLGGSLVLMIFGFLLWYWMTQRHQDLLLRIQTGEQLPVEERKEPANAGRKWTEGEEAALREGFDAGKKYEQLAKKHKRSKRAILSRLSRLGLLDDSNRRDSEDG